MATATTTSTPAFDLPALIQSLPACKRCRECRRGCDTLLPKCRQCTKAGVECMFYDHGRNELLRRSYISELIDHVRRLDGQSHPPTTASPSDATKAGGLSVSLKADSISSERSLHYEHHFAYALDAYRYLGSEACLIKSHMIEAANYRAPFQRMEEDEDWQLSTKESPAKKYELLELFLQTINAVYPILDPSLRYLKQDLPPNLTPTEQFSLYMIYSISCYILPNTGKRQHAGQIWNPTGRLSYHQANSIKYRALATQYFTNAMEHLEAATIEPTIATLRAVLLLAINSTFDPKTGNYGQQVALAARLAFDLESKMKVEGKTEPSDIEQLRNIHMAIFSLENQYASTLDRPALFPEPDSALCFDKTKPADYMCSLFRLQNRFRKGDYAMQQSVKRLLPPLDEKAELLPIMRITLHMTHLLCNPCWGSAWHVLEAVVSLGGVHIFITPHWVYRAGSVLIQNIPAIFGGNLIQLYSNALLVLELSSWKWPSSAALSASLVDLMAEMKTKFRPDWSDTLQQGDVRI